MKLKFPLSFLCTSGLLGLVAIAPPTLSQAGAQSSPADSRLEIPASDDGLPGAGPIRRYDWFRKLWMQRRQAWHQRVEQDKGALVFLGDSITQGWEVTAPDLWTKYYSKLGSGDFGVSGDTWQNVFWRLTHGELKNMHARVVVLPVPLSRFAFFFEGVIFLGN